MKTIAAGLALFVVACVSEAPEDVAASYEAISTYASTPRAAIHVTRLDDAEPLDADADAHATADARATAEGDARASRARLAGRVYTADFASGRIDVGGAPIAGSFVDPALPKGYAPFNVAALDGTLYVAYGTTNELGGGIVDAFDADGRFLARVAQGGSLDAPHALALAPASWGRFAGALLVGNHGDGAVHLFDPRSGRELGLVADAAGPIAIAHLWTLRVEGGAVRFESDVASGTLVPTR
ncbi:MAG: TIGR03118 family protein [Labilithrix sp.]|nr:TIGR03118 family protein [Labilithrix sp.]MCW5811203.1 TIGR03118 family protein [Labilithrix sp.]